MDTELQLSQLITEYAATPWQYSPTNQTVLGTNNDPDRRNEVAYGSSVLTDGDGDINYATFHELQTICWEKFNENPFVFTNVIDTVGRLTGAGFAITSNEWDLQQVIDEFWTDPRNNLPILFPQYVARKEIQGELFLVLTTHPDGFVECDFMSPSVIKGFSDNSGIFVHPNKPTFPLCYRLERSNGSISFVNSINVAYYPKLAEIVAKNQDIIKPPEPNRWIVSFDSGFVTKRNVGRVKTILEWLDYYRSLKQWEIDHKKSSGAYLWEIQISDAAALRGWLAMTPEQKKATGLTGPKVPGGTLILPPGMKVSVHNPKLTSISNQDTDILHLISSGLNTTEDIMTGSSSGQTYGGVKMSRAPISDRTADATEALDRFLRYVLFRAVFFLKNGATGLALTYKQRKAVAYNKKGEPVFKTTQLPAHELVEVDYPVSEVSNLSDRTGALLGVKHGSLIDTLGLPPSLIAKRLGFGSYRARRLQAETEKELMSGLMTSAESEANMEQVIEPPVKKKSATDREEQPQD